MSNLILEGGNPSGTTVLPDCTGCGGAISASGPNTTIVIENSTLRNNTALWGGAIYVAMGIVEMEKLTVINSPGKIDGEPFSYMPWPSVSRSYTAGVLGTKVENKSKFYTYEGWKCNGLGADSNDLMGYTIPFVTYLYTANTEKITIVFNRKVRINGIDSTPFLLFVNGVNSPLRTDVDPILSNDDKHLTLRADSAFSSTDKLDSILQHE